MELVIILGIAVTLFAIAFVTKRRFGVLGLGLAAGVVLAQLWAVSLSILLGAQNIPTEPLSHLTVAQVLLTLLPALLLLITGPKYHDKRGAFLGSLLFATLATLFIVSPITRDFSIEGDTSPIFDFITQWQNVLVGVGVALAIADMLHAHGPKLPRKHTAKH